MNNTNVAPKFRISLNAEELQILILLLEADKANILENMPLLGKLKKMLRKIQFDLVEPAFISSNQNAVGARVEAMIQSSISEAAYEKYKGFLDNTKSEAPSEEEVELAIMYKAETLRQELEELEKPVFNKVLAARMGF